MSGSGMFTNKSAVKPHLLQGGGLAGEIADLRRDVAETLLQVAAITVDEYTNPAAADPDGIKLSVATLTTEVTYSGAALDGVVGGDTMTYARNITVTTSDDSSTWDGVLTVNGTYNGEDQSEELTLANNTTIVGTKPFDVVTSLVVDPQVDTNGNYTVGFGTGLGTHSVPKARANKVNIIREIVDSGSGGALVTTGALTATGLYTPSAAPDASKDYCIFYEYDTGNLVEAGGNPQPSLTTRISTEEVARASADTSLTTRVSTEEVARASVATSLTTRVSTEEVARASAVTSLNTRVSTETAARASADTSIDARISSLIASIDA